MQVENVNNLGAKNGIEQYFKNEGKELMGKMLSEIIN
jgi:hypothetical protein